MIEAIKGWAVWHPTKGFDEQYEGPIAYADLDQNMIESVTDRNETDGTNKLNGWRAVAVVITIAPAEQAAAEPAEKMMGSARYGTARFQP